MSRDEIVQKVAQHFEIEPDETGKYDLESYAWQAGCYLDSGKWLNLLEVVKCIEDIVD